MTQLKTEVARLEKLMAEIGLRSKGFKQSIGPLQDLPTVSTPSRKRLLATEMALSSAKDAVQNAKLAEEAANNEVLWLNENISEQHKTLPFVAKLNLEPTVLAGIAQVFQQARLPMPQLQTVVSALRMKLPIHPLAAAPAASADAPLPPPPPPPPIRRGLSFGNDALYPPNFSS